MRSFRLSSSVKKLLPLASLILAAAVRAQPTPSFTVVCERGGRHAADADSVPAERELQLLRDAVSDTYPLLPPELQDVARRITFMVNHDKKNLTKRYMGWSAEDDPDYRYPDTQFFPGGTIKANFTEKFIKALDLGTRLGETDPRALAGVRVLWREIVSHELRHAWQYHTGPVRDLASAPEMVREGLADEALLAETKKKVAYEHAAFATGRSFQVGHREDLLSLADAIEAYASANADLFADGAPYHLAALDAANPVVGRYLREDSKDIDLGDRFNDSEKIIYEGQYAPAEIVLRLKKRNDVLEAAARTAGALNVDDAIPASRDDSFKAEWKGYMEAGKLSEAVKDSYPYLRGVEARYNQELERYDRLTGGR